MGKEFYDTPLTYEEALARKEEVLQMINNYNLAFFNGTELPYTEEEINDLQEEYQYLCDCLQLTDEEKVLKNDQDKIIENEDGTIEVKKTFFDKVSIWVYIYVFLSTFLLSGILNSLIGTEIYEMITKIIYQTMYNNDAHLFMKEMSEFSFGCLYYISYLIYPILFILCTMILFFIVKKRGKVENKKVLFWTLLVQITLSIVVSLILIFGTLAKEFASLYKDTIDYGYAIWCYEKLYETDTAKLTEILLILGLA